MKSLLSIFLAACSACAFAEPGAAKPSKVDFRREVLPIISSKCFHCHGPDASARKAKLRLDVREDALRERDGFWPIVAGNAAKSEVMARIHSKDEEEVMPPPKEDKPLTPAQAEVLRKWIEQGADYDVHWSFVKPQWHAPPSLPPGMRARNGIDNFVAAKLVAEGLPQSPETDKYTLLRRAALDLTGLPPTPQEIAAFEADASPEAYEHAVDRLLALPAFGEKWARMWLDLARYADSTGYGSDKFRMNIWPYRDWVISAFNRNVPYDQFSTEQLAGDLLPQPTVEQMTATAFHRNTMTQVEGGTDDEEYRVVAVKDRVGTTMQVWMGLTANCAQCHSHKFDPISHKEYYQLYAIFNQSEDADREDEAPRIPLKTGREEEQRRRLDAELAALETKAKEATPDFEREMHEWEADVARPAKWEPLTVLEAATRNARLEPQPDGSLLAPAQLADKEKYTVKARTNLRGITAFRVEVLPAVAGKAIGGSGGNAVLTELLVAAQPAVAIVPRGRFVRVEMAAPGFLHLAEVQAFHGAENVALKGKATQSSTGFDGAAGLAMDGNTDGSFTKKSVSHTGEGDRAPWWEVDLGSEQSLDQLVLWNRTDSGTQERIVGARVSVLDAQRRSVFSRTLDVAPKPNVALNSASGVNVTFAATSADFAQQGFAAGAAVDGDSKTGWAFLPRTTQAHAAVFEVKTPLDFGGEALLTFTLRQDYGGGHNLARVRITATTQTPPVRELPEGIHGTLALEPSERTEPQRAELADHFRPMSKAFASVAKQIEAKRAELAKIKPLELPIMRELAANKRRVSHILNKGNFLSPGEEVTAAMPVSFGPVPGQKPDRLGLARWIFSPENPLTARVSVNRFWSQIFGAGLTEIEEDFGTQGQFPSHPELLDWLALAFQSPNSADSARPGLGWDMKALIRLLVTSHTYRQSSQVSEAARRKDERNLHLSHAPRRRLDAEAIRDQALAISGLLSPKLGGPSVYPPQPDGLWSVAFNGGQNAYPTSVGEDRHRRGLYTFWRRTAPNPTMTTFDAPSRESCTIRRVPTNTPLQAFVTLNDPVFVECAQALARRILIEARGTVDERIRWALQLCLGRPGTELQVAALRELFDVELQNYRTHPNEAKLLADGKDSPLPAGMDAAEAAVWTVVANVLLNLDAVLTRG